MPRFDDILIAPSILAADFAAMGDAVRAIDEAGAEWVHLDVMDGHFVPNITFGPQMIKAIRPHTTRFFDAHLMISPADPYLADFAAAGAELISVHVEAGPHLHRSLQAIRALGVKAGVVLNPATPANAIAPVMDLVDLVLVMTVNPGFGGQKFIASQLPKIAEIRQMIDATGRDIWLQIDGGVAPDTAADVVRAGANVLVAGSAIFGQPDIGKAIAELRRAAREGLS